MSKASKKKNTLFAIYPNANGFGFVYMDGPRNLLEHGVVRISPIRNNVIMERVRRSFDYMRPSVVLVQNPDSKFSRTGKRVRQLILRIATQAKKEKLAVAQYSRDQIRDVFEQFGATTKYEISQVLLTEFKELQLKTPKKRKLWTSEDRNMAIFDALSLAIAWYYLNE